MVGHAILRKVVSANLLGAVARADLRETLGTFGSLLLGKHLLVEACAKNGHRRNLVLQLRLLVLRLHDKTSRQVRDAHSGVSRVDALSTRAAGAEHVDAQVVLVDVDLNLVGLGKHGNGRRGRVDAALAFRLGHALHAVHAGLVLHDGVHLVALHLELDFLVTACLGRGNVHKLDLPLLGRAEALVHLEEVACEDCRLVAAGSSADLHDDVLLVGGVRGNEHELDVLFEGGHLRFGLGNGLLRELLHVGIGEHLLGVVDVAAACEVLARLRGERALVRVFLGEVVVCFLIGENRRVAHLRLELLVGGNDLLELLAHVVILHCVRSFMRIALSVAEQ